MGAIDATSDPVAALIAQVNRFGPGGPPDYRYIDTAYPLATGKVPVAVAVSAAMLLHRRGQDAVLRFGDKGSIELLRKAGLAQVDPVGYVTANLASVTAEIKAFGDSVGAPSAYGLTTWQIKGVPILTFAIAATGVAALAFIILGRK